MATDVSVVIAYRDMGDPHRAQAFRYVLDWWQGLDVEIVVESGTSDATFTRATAINAAVTRANGDLIIAADPDSLVPADPSLVDALAVASAADGLVIPHDQYLYLTPAATADVYGGADLWAMGPQHCEFHGRNGQGNVVVFHRSVWQKVGGLDERFPLWGGDDAAFSYATHALVGPMVRLPGPMVHLWHHRLPQSEPGHPGYAEQFALLAQYRDAAAQGPDAVRALVEARRV